MDADKGKEEVADLLFDLGWQGGVKNDAQVAELSRWGGGAAIDLKEESPKHP